MFQKTENPKHKKNEIPNRFQNKPVLTFKPDPEIQGYLKKLSTNRERSKFINESIKKNYFLTFYPKKFILDLVQLNFGLVKHILRQVGRAR